jgi:adenosylhomocysteine nucleosidase
MKLGVIAALKTELHPTLAAFSHASRRVEHLRFHETPSLAFVAGGIGAKAAAAASLVMVDHFKPDALVSTGFCGAITDDLAVGDLLIGRTTKSRCDEALLELARTAAPQSRQGSLRTVEKVILKAEDKKKLKEETGAVAVDMEAEAVALAARSRGVKFLSVKVVIDTPSEPLASSYAGCGRVLLDLLSNPMTIGQMIYDSKRVKLAADRLKDFFLALRDKLPVS